MKQMIVCYRITVLTHINTYTMLVISMNMFINQPGANKQAFCINDFCFSRNSNIPYSSNDASIGENDSIHYFIRHYNFCINNCFHNIQISPV